MLDYLKNMCYNNCNALSLRCNMDIIREKTICFTGHRPEKLPFGGAEAAGEIKVIKRDKHKNWS